MKKFALLKTPEIFFFNFVVFLLCFVWLRYFLPSFFICLLLSLIVCFCVSFVVFKNKHKKHIKLQTEKEKQKANEQYLNTLKLSSTKNNTNYFYNILSQNHTCTKNFISIQISAPTILNIFPIFKFEELSESDIAKVYSHKKNNQQIIVLCDSISKNASKLASALKIVVYEKNDVFLLLNSAKILPNKTQLHAKNKTTFCLIIKNALNKKRCKSYAVAAIVLLFSSFLVPFKIYYLIFSTILFVLSVLCLFPFSFAQPTKTEKLL